VYGWDSLVLLQHLLDDGLSKTAIAQRLGVSRRVIYHWLKTGQLARDVDTPVPRQSAPHARGASQSLARPARRSGRALAGEGARVRAHERRQERDRQALKEDLATLAAHLPIAPRSARSRRRR